MIQYTMQTMLLVFFLSLFDESFFFDFLDSFIQNMFYPEFDQDLFVFLSDKDVDAVLLIIETCFLCYFALFGNIFYQLVLTKLNLVFQKYQVLVFCLFFLILFYTKTLFSLVLLLSLTEVGDFYKSDINVIESQENDFFSAITFSVVTVLLLIFFLLLFKMLTFLFSFIIVVIHFPFSMRMLHYVLFCLCWCSFFDNVLVVFCFFFGEAFLFLLVLLSIYYDAYSGSSRWYAFGC